MSSEVVRKRLSRALARLRLRLRRTERGQEAWGLALFSLAGGGKVPLASDEPLVTTPAQVLPSIPAAAMFSSKLLILLGAAATATAIAFLSVRGPGSREIALDGSGGRDRATSPVAALFSGSEPGERADVRSSGVEPLSVSASTPEWRPLQVDTALPVQEGELRGAWIAEGLQVQVLDFAADGSARLPTGTDMRVFVASEGHYARYEDVESGEDPVRMTLVGADLFTGLITVDGEVPGEPMRPRLLRYGEDPGIEDFDVRKDFLRGCGAIPDHPDFLVGPDGIFRLQPYYPVQTLRLLVPPAFVVSAVNGEEPTGAPDYARLNAGPEGTHIDLSRLPSVRGQYIWADDGSPVAGMLDYLRIDERGYSLDGMRSTSLGPEGVFAISVFEQLDALKAIDPEQPGRTVADRAVGRRAGALWLTLSGHQHMPGARLEVPVTGEVFPIELGQIRVARIPERTLRVLGRQGEGWVPLRATVVGPHVRVTTDDEGEAVVRGQQGDALDVLAMGYDFVRRHLEEGDGIQEIRLEPAPVFGVHLGVGWESRVVESSVFLRLGFEDSPFGPWSAEETEAPAYGHEHHKEIYGRRRYGLSLCQIPSGWVDFYVPGNGSLDIAGLGRGARFRVSLVDCLGRAFTEEVVVLDEPEVLDLRDRQLAVARLTVHAHAPDGSGVTRGQVVLRSMTGRSRFVNFEGSTCELGPLVPGRVELSVTSKGVGTLDLAAFELTEGQRELDLTLEEE